MSLVERMRINVLGTEIEREPSSKIRSQAPAAASAQSLSWNEQLQKEASDYARMNRQLKGGEPNHNLRKRRRERGNDESGGDHVGGAYSIGHRHRQQASSSSNEEGSYDDEEKFQGIFERDITPRQMQLDREKRKERKMVFYYFQYLSH
eukprot:jgi/Bigna1/144476/aug1.88_g19184